MSRTSFLLSLTLVCGACASVRTDQAGAASGDAPCDPNAAPSKGAVPDRCEAATAMQALASEIAGCSNKPGAVAVTVVFDPYGTVRDAQVEAQGFDVDAMLCVKGNALRAKVRPFSASEFEVKWSYQLGGGSQ